MRGLKFVPLFAACGFILSLFSGLFSRSGILRILVQALIFGIVFGLLALLIRFLFLRYLYDDSSQNLESEPQAPAPAVGGKVDIVVEDEDLPDSGSGNRFAVSGKHGILSGASDSGLSDVAGENASPDPVPVRGGNSYSDASVSGDGSAAGSAVRPAGNDGTAVYGDDDLDVLPDMDDVVVSDDRMDVSDGMSSGGGGYVPSVEHHSPSGTASAGGMDTELMAKAISSVLSEEAS